MPRGKKKTTKKPKKPKPVTNTKVFRKRGRKPKGGKIVSKADLENKISPADIPNIILHLKCSSKELERNPNSSNLALNAFNSYSMLRWKTIQEKSITKIDTDTSDEGEPTNKVIWTKLKELEKRLHFNDVFDKKSNCFFCTYPFNNPRSIYPDKKGMGYLKHTDAFVVRNVHAHI